MLRVCRKPDNKQSRCKNKSIAMKKFSFFVSVLVFLSISSQEINAQGERIDPCPPGFCATGVSFVIDQFNFHKPRTGCQSGFGICLKGHLEASCTPCWANGKTDYQNGKVTGWFKISKNKLELHLPLALGQSKEFIKEDMSVFCVDDDTITILNTDGSTNCKLKGGEYTVTISGSDYLILIDII